LKPEGGIDALFTAGRSSPAPRIAMNGDRRRLCGRPPCLRRLMRRMDIDALGPKPRLHEQPVQEREIYPSSHETAA
jgi:hypothetical protein